MTSNYKLYEPKLYVYMYYAHSVGRVFSVVPTVDYRPASSVGLIEK